jgi:plasmid stability protein
MAQLIVRNLEDDIRDRLRVLAAAHGRSMEEEVREILRAAVLRMEGEPELGLGTRLARHFRGFKLAEGEIGELRGHPAKPANLDT